MSHARSTGTAGHRGDARHEALWLPDGHRAELRRRYLSLGLGELAAAATFALAAWMVVRERWSASEWVTLWWALGPLLFTLVQAGIYWLAARSWVGRRRMPRPAATAYRVLAWLNPLLLALGLALIVIDGTGAPGPLVVILAVWAFALVEHLNYFVVRLAYPPRRWLREVTAWRRPRLVQDLREARETGRAPGVPHRG